MKEFKDLRQGDTVVIWKSGENNSDEVVDGKEYTIIDTQGEYISHIPGGYTTVSILIKTEEIGGGVWLEENEILNQKDIRNMKLKELLG
jgi:hypothetical protein